MCKQFKLSVSLARLWVLAMLALIPAASRLSADDASPPPPPASEGNLEIQAEIIGFDVDLIDDTAIFHECPTSQTADDTEHETADEAAKDLGGCICPAECPAAAVGRRTKSRRITVHTSRTGKPKKVRIASVHTHSSGQEADVCDAKNQAVASEIRDLIDSLGSILEGTEFDDSCQAECACQAEFDCPAGSACQAGTGCTAVRTSESDSACESEWECEAGGACIVGIASKSLFAGDGCACGKTCNCGTRCACGAGCTCATAGLGAIPHSPCDDGILKCEFELLQAQQDEADENCVENPVYPDARSEKPHNHVIAALRDASHQLEAAANLMEEENLYYRADQLRELAGQLRAEARSAQGGWTLEPLGTSPSEPPPGAQRDLHLEIESLRQELQRTREALHLEQDAESLQR